MSKFEQVQAAIPQPVNWLVIVGGPVLSLLEVVNPILQALAFIVGIVWGGMQMYGWLEKRRQRNKEM